MRTIKFRAWDEGNKKMFSNVQFITSGDDSNDWILFTSNEQQYKVEGNKIVFDNPYCRPQIKIMQFTGLTDKNGKEFYYDSDLVELEGYSGLWIAVKDDFDIPCFRREHDSFELIQFSDYFLKLTQNRNGFEIKGTIQENPELLKR